MRTIRCRACRTMVLGQAEISVARSSFNRTASSAARTRNQCGPSEVLVIGRGRFFDAIMLLVSVGFSFTRQSNNIRCVGMITLRATHLLSCRSLCRVLLGHFSDHSRCELRAPYYLINPDRILSEFLLHFIWMCMSGSAHKVVMMAWCAPRLMGLSVTHVCPSLACQQQWKASKTRTGDRRQKKPQTCPRWPFRVCHPGI